MTGLPYASAFEAADAIKRRRTSSEELTRFILDRIDRWQPSVNAYTTILHEQALASAREADAAPRRGDAAGPLHGVPISIKDAFEIRGVRTTAGAPSLSGHVPATDAVTVARLRRAGAVILGHTNVPLMLEDLQSFNDLFGTTNNPWDLERTPGGSTGGGAAALALGMSFLELGSDLAGSIRLPAHFCGVFGHRPTLNVVPLDGHVPPPPGGAPPPRSEEATAGPLARSARDLELALRVLGGPVAPFDKAYRWELPSPRRRADGWRLGYVLDDPFCPLASDSRDVLAAAIEELRSAGLRLEEGWPAGFSLREAYTAWYFLLNAVGAPELDAARAQSVMQKAAMQDGSREATRALAWTAPYRRSLEVNQRRLQLRRLWEQWFETHDAFLMPVAFVPAFPHDHRRGWSNRTIETPEGPRPYYDLAVWTSVSGLTGHPATVAPAGLTASGLPVGIQILGPYLEDATSIAVAGRVEEVLGGFRSPPEPRSPPPV